MKMNFQKSHLEFKDGRKQNIFIDFHGEAIKWIKINGEYLTKVNFEGHKIEIPPESIKVGGDVENVIQIAFANTYVTNSAGLHWFEDLADKRIYLYTHLEPFFCHRWFPCFDQPGIRAPLQL